MPLLKAILPKLRYNVTNHLPIVTFVRHAIHWCVCLKPGSIATVSSSRCYLYEIKHVLCQLPPSYDMPFTGVCVFDAWPDCNCLFKPMLSLTRSSVSFAVSCYRLLKRLCYSDTSRFPTLLRSLAQLLCLSEI